MASPAARRLARLSELARRVLTAAEQHAAALGHPSVGVGHLLLALLHEQRGSVQHLLHSAGLAAAEVDAGLDAGQAALLADADAIIDAALALAEAAGSHYVGTEHLLLALLQNAAGVDALDAHGAHLAALQHALEAQLRGGH